MTVPVLAYSTDADDRVLVIGDGDYLGELRRQVARLGVEERFLFTGFVVDVREPLARLDIAVHLTRRDSYATSDLSLQELMTAGVVPVVLEGTAPADLVRHESNGLVVRDQTSAVAAVRRLRTDPRLRTRLAREASQATHNGPEAFMEVYRSLLEAPKQARVWPGNVPTAGCDRFVATLGALGGAFRDSMTGLKDELADAKIAASAPALCGPGAGGVLHYRGFYPTDPFLRYWSGLIHAAKGDRITAAAELLRARSLGMAEERVARQLQRAVSFGR